MRDDDKAYFWAFVIGAWVAMATQSVLIGLAMGFALYLAWSR